MAVLNLFSVTSLVVKGDLMDYSASLKTPLMATAYKKFDMNATQGDSISELYPYKWNVIQSLEYDPDTQTNNTIDRYQKITLGATNVTTGTALVASLPFSLTAKQMTYFSHATSVGEFKDYYMTTNGLQIGDSINQAVIDSCYEWWPDVVGDPTQAVDGFNSMQNINAQISKMQLMNANRSSGIRIGWHPDAFTQLQVPYATTFNESVNAPMLKNGRTSFQAGLQMYDDNLIRQHQNGTFDTPGTVQIAATVPQGDINTEYQTFSLKGFTPSASEVLRGGDLIFIGTPVNPVNRLLPIGKQNSYQYKYFVVLSDDTGSNVIDADGSGNATIRVRCVPIFQQGVMPNPYANISRQIVLNDVVNLFGGANLTWTKNLVFAKNGFRFANPPIATYPLQPNGGGEKLSAFPYERVEKVKIPGTNGMELSFNVSNVTQAGSFKNNWTTRTICGTLPYENYGFIYASKAGY